MNDRGKILHVCLLDKFIPSFIDFVEENFSDFATKHLFFLFGDRQTYSYQARDNTIYAFKGCRLKNLCFSANLAYYIQKADKVILHGLFDPDVVRLLACMPWALQKCYWIIWGGDLYAYNLERHRIREFLNEYARRKVIKQLGHLVTYIKGDYQLACKWYGAKGDYHKCLMYTSNIFDVQLNDDSAKTIEIKNPLHILVGNSSNPSNNHIEALEKLLPFRDQDIKIFVPLSYGNHEHARYVKEIGQKWFGSKFYPLTEFVPLSDYLKFLRDIDIAIFNHNRQQAMGNTITLLGLGKKVFMRNDVNQWEFLRDLGIILFDINDINIDKMDLMCSTNNKDQVQKYFSKQMLKNQLSSIFA